jgi:predicted ArsR family transcriptional regulator
LVDLLLRYGLEKLSEQAVREWAQKRTERKISRVDMAAHPGLMKRDEKRVLQALEQLHASSEGAWRFGADEIADRAGVRRAAAYWALQALRTGGLVEGHEVEGAGRDRWGRPTQSIWSMISAKPQQ